MRDRVIAALLERAEHEPYARKLGIRVLELAPGRAIVEMALKDDLRNIFHGTHGGAIFSLIDEAFQLSCNTHGTVAVGLSVTVNYHNPPDVKGILRAESREIHRSRKTGTYEIKVTDERNTLIASCQAVAYRRRDPLPFLEGG
jgi:acyl-CoA thioesterase